MDVTETLVYERGKFVTFNLVIGNEARKVRFKRDYLPLNLYWSHRLVWVAIPEKDSIDNRTWLNRFARYSNKVRSAFLQVRKIDGRYILLDRYEVLKRDAEIISWVNSKKGKRIFNETANGYARACGTYQPYKSIGLFD
jgi:hypothetical protein